MSFPTAEEISSEYDFTGKVAIVTGGNTGIGKETVRVLAKRNCHVILCSRSEEKGEVAKQEILQSIGQEKSNNIEVMKLNLDKLQDIRDFYDRFEKRNTTVNKGLHYLILNAGVLNASETPVLSEDGYEIHFAVNHLGHYLLTSLLLPHLKASQPSRIAVLSSEAYLAVEQDLDVEDFNFVKRNINSAPFSGYNFSKLYNLYFSNELNKRLEGTGVICNSVYPGLIKTDLFRNLDIDPDVIIMMISESDDIPVYTIEQGAANTLFVVGSPKITTGGQYFKDFKPTPLSDVANNQANAIKLFEISERLTGSRI